MYAAHIVEATENETPELQDFHVLQNFKDVFLDEIPGIPPKRNIDFTIELMLGATTVFKTPYRMSTLKMIEPKMQLQELLEKMYIRTSVSP